MNVDNITVDESWRAVLSEYLDKDSFKELLAKVSADYLAIDKTVYPKQQDVFSAFNSTSFDDVKVVILGQDPYHNPRQAHGLCFSVPSGTQAPPSLKNIFKEICNEFPKSPSCKLSQAESVNLTRWAQQGVFLLNAVLTVLKNQPGSHSNIGWQDFTDYVIKTISDKRENVVFMLWGAYARSKKDLINSNKHLILEAPHPSPLSAHRGFFGCNHFSKANEYLKKRDKTPINW